VAFQAGFSAWVKGVTGQSFADQRLVVYGAGTAGTGMADQIHAGMVRDGLSPEEATKRIWLIDRAGLITDDMEDLPDYQQAYARPASEVADWTREHGRIGLLETVRQVHPTILIGTSTDHGAFTREVIEEMSSGVERPIVLPLSNPTERIEALVRSVLDGEILPGEVSFILSSTPQAETIKNAWDMLRDEWIGEVDELSAMQRVALLAVDGWWANRAFDTDGLGPDEPAIAELIVSLARGEGSDDGRQ